jgi:uncharacterized protein YcbK (DUF882 family)
MCREHCGHWNDDAPASRRRRRLLGAGVAVFFGLASPGVFAHVRPQGQRRLALANLHTGERIEEVYWRNGVYQAGALERINWVLRDFRENAAIAMDRDLIDLLYRLRVELDAGEGYEIISGYRTPKTNAMLRARSSGVARRSMHTLGRAADIRRPGVALAELRDAALSMRRGGVGYYPKSRFVHVDTGRVRTW